MSIEEMINSERVLNELGIWQKEVIARVMQNYAEQEKNNNWISVKDRLPEKDGDSSIYCLVYDIYNGVVVRPYNEYHKCWDDESADDYYTDAIDGKITHWQSPLPEPPKQN